MTTNNSKKNGRRNAKNGNGAARKQNISRGLQIHRFSRHVDEGFVLKAATDQGLGYGFNLADLPAFTEYTALFDRWRIVNIEASFLYQTTAAQTTNCYPLMLMSEDLNDNLSPATEQVLLERENTRLCPFGPNNMMYRHNFKPRTLATGSSAALSVEVKDAWVDCLAPSTDFFGLKVFLVNYNTAASAGVNIRVLFRYDMEFQTSK